MVMYMYGYCLVRSTLSYSFAGEAICGLGRCHKCFDTCYKLTTLQTTSTNLMSKKTFLLNTDYPCFALLPAKEINYHIWDYTCKDEHASFEYLILRMRKLAALKCVEIQSPLVRSRRCMSTHTRYRLPLSQWQ